MQSFAKGLSRSRTRRQSGSVATLGALWLMVAVICLATIDIGNVFWQKRELQKIADLAALAGASNGVGECIANAKSIAKNNGLNSNKDSIDIKCGNWSVENSKGAPDVFFEEKNPFNASRVVVSRVVDYLFIFNSESSSRKVEAIATAKQNPPIASLSIRSTLATVNSTQSNILNFILGKMLGTNLNISAVGWDGIAKSQINLLSFLKPLIGDGISADIDLGKYDSLLGTNVEVGKIVEAMVGAVKPGEAANVGISALTSIVDLLKLSSLKIKLADILKIDNGVPFSALDVGVSALDMIQAIAQVATKNNAAKLDLKLQTLGLADVNLALRVIEPAQISITANPEISKIEVRTAQIRLLVSISSKLAGFLSKIVNGLLSLLNGIGGLLSGLFGGTSADIEILASDPFRVDLLIDAARGYARVTDFECGAKKSLDVLAEKAAVDIYLGSLGNGEAQIYANAFGAGIPVVNTIPLLDVGGCKKLLGCDSKTREPYYFGGIGLGGKSEIISQKRQKTFYGDALSGDIFDSMGFSNLDSIYGKVASLKIIQSIKKDGVDENLIFKILENITNNLLSDLLNILNPVTKILDEILNSLGISLNKVDVAPRLICGGERSVSLVY